jgi:hypothetical protein
VKTSVKARSVAAVLCILTLLVLAATSAGCGGEESAPEERKGPSDLEVVEKEGAVPADVEEAGEGALYAGADSSTRGDLPAAETKIIKNATVELLVEKGEYPRVRREALASATSSGGYLESEDSGKDEEGKVQASLTLRIPAESFESVLEEVSSLGEVESTRVSTRDVSGEYVDLESRLRHLQVEEAFYLSLISKAETVEEMISIREHLSSVQLEKEKVQGRMKYLDQQVEYSTLTLLVKESSPEGESGFWSSVKDALESFARGMRTLALAFFYALPWLVLILVIASAVWLLLRRRRKGGSGEAT